MTAKKSTSREGLTSENVITGRHVLFAVVAFFGVIFAINGVFLYHALSTYTGVVSQQPYRKGLDYNRRIEAGKAQEATGWSDKVSLNTDTGLIELAILDRTKAPVPGLVIKGSIGRPSTDKSDIPFTAQQSASKLYTAQIGSLASGTWIVDAEAAQLTSSGERIVYRMRRRIWLKPQD